MASGDQTQQETTTTTTATTTTNGTTRTSPLDYRNTDLVSRLLAATPPYLYNTSLAPNTFFFSEMLRSLVQAKTDRTISNNGTMGSTTRRTRKRQWTQSKLPSPPPRSSADQLPWKPWRSIEPAECSLEPPQSGTVEASSSLILPPPPPPPPPPIWYPPYGIDPLHFFIDLRVSSHISDRKKQQQQQQTLDIHERPKGFKTSKHTSAFSVPMKHHHPINLSKSDMLLPPPPSSKLFDITSLGFEGAAANKTGVNYVMSNINRVYKDLQAHDDQVIGDDDANQVTSHETTDGIEVVDIHDDNVLY